MDYEAPRTQQTRKARYALATQAAKEEGFSPQEVRGALKVIRRYELTGYPFSSSGWTRDVRYCRLAIAISLIRFFQALSLRG